MAVLSRIVYALHASHRALTRALVRTRVCICCNRTLPDPRKDPAACGQVTSTFVCDPDG
jgi:hypothetical protein